MKAEEWLREAEESLREASVATARLDCLVLLEDATGKDRGWLLAHPEFELPAALTQILNAKIYRRKQHVPLAYIRGKAEFYGREFTVNAHTLVPRPETEAMIEMLKRVSRLESDIMSWEDGGRRHRSRRHIDQSKMGQLSSLVHTEEGYKVVWDKPAARKAKRIATSPEHLRPNDQNFYIIDVGTGSGAIAITAKLELPAATVSAIDIDEKCLETARENAERLGAKVTFLHGNLLEPLAKNELFPLSIYLCNLPYVPDNFEINTAATHEPRHALFGGSDGLDLYRELFAQLKTNTAGHPYVLTESLPPQHETLADLAKAAGFALRETDDFIQLFEPIP